MQNENCSIEQAQFLGFKGDEALYGARWGEAKANYTEAIAMAEELLRSAQRSSIEESNSPKELLNSFLNRYKEKLEQLSAYLDFTLSSDASLEVPDLTSVYNSSFHGGGTSTVMNKSKVYLNKDKETSWLPPGLNDSTSNIMDNPTGEYPWVEVEKMFWLGVEKLLTLLPNTTTTHLSSTNKSTQHNDTYHNKSKYDVEQGPISLDASFVLLPKSKGDNEAIENLQKQLSDLIQQNQQLQQQNKQLQQQMNKNENTSNIKPNKNVDNSGKIGGIFPTLKVNDSAAINELMKENTKLIRSISNFRTQVQNHTNMCLQRSEMSMMAMKQSPNRIAQGTLTSPLGATTIPLPLRNRYDDNNNSSTSQSPSDSNLLEIYKKRIIDLEATVHTLYLKLQKKEKEAEKYLEYKQKWVNLKRNAREKKRRDSVVESEKHMDE